MKRILALIIALIMLCSLFVACGDSNNESKAPESTAEPASTGEQSANEPASAEESSEPEDPYSHLRSFDFNNEECIFLVVGDSGDRYKSVEIIPNETSPDPIRDAVAARNAIVEDLLNVTISEVRTNNFVADARNDIEGEGQYDIIMPWMTHAASLAGDGNFYDLNTFSDIIKLENPYWDQRANEDLSFGNKLFFTTGDFSLLTYDCTHAIVFNKKLARDSGCDDMYQLLLDDKWTFDALWENAKLVTADTNGVDGMTYEDTWGFYLNQNFTTSMFIGAGERLTTKDSDDIPVMTPINDRYSAVVEKIRQIYNDATSTIIIEDYAGQIGGKDKDVYSAASRATGENRALFRSLAMVDLAELDDYEVEYGLLPVPKFNEDQDEYYNIVSAFLASCICIGNTVEDPEMSAAVAEALAISSTDTVRRAYYETILKGRRIPDEAGEFALDIIFNNRTYEIATIYTFGNLSTLIQTCARSSQDILASTYQNMENAVKTAIDDLRDTFDSIS